MAATEARSRVRVKHFWTFDGSAQPWAIDLLAGNDWYEEPPGMAISWTRYWLRGPYWLMPLQEKLV